MITTLDHETRSRRTAVNRSWTRAAALAGVILLGWSAVADAQGVLRRGNRGEPAGLDPHLSISTALEDVINNDMFEGLTTVGADGTILPGTAKSWTISDDGKTYRFKLRQNAQWSDGKPVTAHDFVFSFRRVVTPATAMPMPKYFNFIENGAEALAGKAAPEQLAVKAIDDHTLEIKLKAPWVPFISATAHFSMLPVPQHVVERHKDKWALPGNIVSNGPFALVEWRPKEHVKVVKNPKFHAAASVSLDGVEYLPISDTTTAFNMFKAGELDLSLSLPENQLPWIKQNIPTTLRIDPLFGNQYIVINTDKLKDARIRRALQLATDTDTLVNKVLRNETKFSKSFTPDMLKDYKPPTFELGNAPMAERIAAAKKLMQEAGYSDGKRFEVSIRLKDRPAWKTAGVGLAGMWGAVHVDLKQQIADSATHEAALLSGDFTIAYSGDIESAGDPALYAARFITGDAMNYFRYSSPQVDQALKAALVETDQQKRLTLMREAETTILRDVPIIPVFEFDWKNLVQNWVVGWENNAYLDHRSRWLTLKRPQRS